MTIYVRTVWSFLCLLLSVAGIGTSTLAQEVSRLAAKDSGALCTMHIALTSGGSNAAKPVVLKVTITTVSGKDQSIHAGPIDLHSRPFRLDVVDSKGAAVPRREEKPEVPSVLVIPEDMPSPGGRTYLFKAGEVINYAVNLSDLYDITKPGTYLVRGHEFSRADREWIRSNELSIIVK